LDRIYRIDKIGGTGRMAAILTRRRKGSMVSLEGGCTIDERKQFPVSDYWRGQGKEGTPPVEKLLLTDPCQSHELCEAASYGTLGQKG